MQRVLTVIPVFKALYDYQISIELFTCPWDSSSLLVNLTLFTEQILSILTVICYATIINGLFYMMCKGWGTTLSLVNKTIITNLMIIGGAIYLLQLAKSYSNNNDSNSAIFFELAIVGLYSILFRINYGNLREQIVMVQDLLENDEEFPEAMLPAMQLKLYQLKKIRIVIAMYYLP